ncbi:Protein EARLY RESPONSIVE TO DEHYDRATION 15 [Apostasia shenzhenica]|uniref:Protein EARLY RESPONSIVE TO DEHYDRATION 15 n=1 Tax=Apostasia shenzhenica TaxID=1088818 RepID=A0A2I0B1V9_9ASPA|nr:Protein EARLY RESPONSIVE TO DEHYDRATION 15 [Apostasia shenzhenica]
MSTLAVASGVGRSTLNPNAPLFIPAAFQQVEDFSPEWWELVKTTSWFRDHWFRQHQEQETFDGDEEEEDLASLLPDSFDLGIPDQFSQFDSEFDEDASFMEMKENGKSGSEVNPEALIKNLNLKSPKNGVMKHLHEPTRYKEKPVQVVSPKSSSRRIIQQPR